MVQPDPRPDRRALHAAKHADALLGQKKPRIWFDSWSNDNRDNRDNGLVDAADPKERATKGHDGRHYRGGKVWPGAARIPRGIWPATWEEKVPAKSIMYKVCVDIVVEPYRAAGVRLGTRSVSRLETTCRKMKRFHTWREDRGEAYPKLLPGDIITCKNRKHSHSGIVGTSLEILHLPGPSNWLYFDNASDNDMEATWQWTWKLFFGITQVSRLVSSQ